MTMTWGEDAAGVRAPAEWERLGGHRFEGVIDYKKLEVSMVTRSQASDTQLGC